MSDDWTSGSESLGSSLNNLTAVLMQEKGMRFAKGMSDTAHQREVKDLKKAGLNPVLSATGGHGASTPNMPMVQTENPFAGMHDRKVARYQLRNMAYMNKATLKQMESTMNVQDADVNLKGAQALETMSRVPVNEKTKSKIEEEIKRITADIGNINSRTRLNTQQRQYLQTQLPKLEAINRIYKDKKLGSIIAAFKEILGTTTIPHIIGR